MHSVVLNYCPNLTIFGDDWLKQFPKALLNFIEYYNCYCPHGALNYMSPKNYLEKYYSPNVVRLIIQYYIIKPML